MATPGTSPSLAFDLDDGNSGAVPAGASIDPLTGEFSWTPTELQGPGVFRFDVVVTGSSGSDRETITVTVFEVNVPPSLPPIADQMIAEGSELALTITATDADRPANTLSYSLDPVSLANGMSIDPATGQFSWIPNETQGQNEFDVTVTVHDNGGAGGGATDSQTFAIAAVEVNDPPVLATIPAQSTGEGVALTFTAAASDTDLPAQQLRFSLDQASTDLGMSINPSTGAFSWTPGEQLGPGNFTAIVAVSDGGYPGVADPESDFQALSISVAEINRPPVLAAIGNRSVDEQVALAFTASASDPDIPANTLTFSLSGGAGGAVPPGAAITPGGAFSWTPTEPGPAPSPSTSSSGTTAHRSWPTPRPSPSPSPRSTARQCSRPSATARSTSRWPGLRGQRQRPGPPGQHPHLLAGRRRRRRGTGGRGDHLGRRLLAGRPPKPKAPAPTPSTSSSRTTAHRSCADSETITVTVAEINRPPVLAAIGNRSVTSRWHCAFAASATDPDLPANTLTFSLSAGAAARFRRARRSPRAAPSPGRPPRRRAPAPTPSTSSSRTTAPAAG